MALADTIDSAVADFQASLEEAQEEFLTDVQELREEDNSNLEEVLAVIAGISIVDYWMQDLGMQKAVNRLMASFDTLLDDAVFFGAVTESQLISLRDVQQSAMVRFTEDIGSKVRLSLVQGVLQNQNRDQIRRALLQDLDVRPYQVETIIETSMATYSRSLTLLQLQDSPDQKLIYTGPLDSKTRPVCIRMLKEPSLTQEQIEAKYPGALRDGGGFNCRHEWQPLSPNTSNKDTRQKAKVAYQGMMDKAKKKGRSFKVPKTLQQYYESK